MNNDIWDLAIVGAGLIGSAAARYASSYPIKMCVIGPEEPRNEDEKQNRDILASHYDEARIVRSVSVDPVVVTLATRSREQYRYLERRSGIHFYDEVGTVTMGIKNGDTMSKSKSAAHCGEVETQIYNPVAAMKKFPFLHVASDEEVMWEKNTGLINPRKLIQAELKVAQQNGCAVIRDIVSEINYSNHPEKHHIVQTELGRTITTKKVLLTAGAFTEINQILPRGVQPLVEYITNTVIFAEVHPDDLQALKKMPCVLRELETIPPTENTCYVLPPIRYPDGKYYVKLGHGRNLAKIVSKEEIQPWCCNQPPTYVKEGLVRILQNLFPAFRPVSISTDTCITTHTPDAHIFLDFLSQNTAIVIGANGYGAKICDHVGKMAADMIVHNDWRSDLPRDWFKFRNKTSVAKL